MKLKLQEGDIFFWTDKGESFLGKAIQYFNNKAFPNSEWLPTHCGIISYVAEDIVTIHEAGPNGFLSSDYPIEWLEDRIEAGYCKIGRCIEPLNDVYENCEKYKGIKYGWLDLIGIALSYLIGWRVIGLTGKNALICSEAVSRILYDSTKEVNIAEEYDVVYDTVTPAQIFLSKFIKIIKI